MNVAFWRAIVSHQRWTIRPMLSPQNTPEALKDDVLALEQVGVEPHPVHKVPTLFFQIVRIDSVQRVGEINLRLGSNPHIERYAGHIGYTIDPAHRGHHYAARATRLLLPLAHERGLNPLWLTCDPDNLASRRSCELAGAQLIEIVDVPADCIIHRSGHPRKCRYRLDL
jgi:predicted acetyltransferase